MNKAPNIPNTPNPNLNLVPDEPLQEFEMRKLWNVRKADFVYVLFQRFINTTRNKKGDEVKLEYYKPAADIELDEEKAKKNCEHYGIDFPTEEFDAFKEFEEQKKLAEKMGVL